jgi:hypothetical protein
MRISIAMRHVPLSGVDGKVDAGRDPEGGQPAQ